MEGRIEESTESRKTEALPMREILKELFVWCQARFPDFTVAAEEMS